MEKKKVDFCFLVDHSFLSAKLYVLIAKELENRGYSNFFITTSKAGDRIFRKFNKLNFLNLDKLSSEINISENELETKITKLEETFGIENIRIEIMAQKYIYEETNEEIMVQKLVSNLVALKNLFDKELKVKYFIQGIAGYSYSRAFYYAGRKYGKHIVFLSSPFDNSICFSSNTFLKFEINEERTELKETDKKFILEWINKEKEKKELRLGGAPLSEINPYITKQRFKKTFLLIKNYKIENLPALFIFKNFFRRYFRQFYVRKLYSKPLLNEKYIFFPLHLPNDSQLTVRGIPFLSQEFIVEILSRHLPYGYKLYVKEHPANLGTSSVKMLKYISKLPNVKLIPPETNPHDLIKNAKIICVINSTVGFEALMYRKPIITFGESFYSGKGVTLDCRNFYDLPQIINQAKSFKPDWNKILTLFNLWYKNSFPPAPKTIYLFEDPREENIKIFCSSLLKYIKRRYE